MHCHPPTMLNSYRDFREEEPTQIPSIVIYMYLLSCIATVAATIFLFLTMRKLIRKRKGKIVIGLLAVLLALCLYGSGVAILDLPYLVNGELETASGRVVAYDAAGHEDVAETRGITIETEFGERIKRTTYDTPVHQNEYVEIAYLPHTHFGIIAERNAE